MSFNISLNLRNVLRTAAQIGITVASGGAAAPLLKLANLPAVKQLLARVASPIVKDVLNAVKGFINSPAIAPAFVPRFAFNGPHMDCCRGTYAESTRVGTQIRPGDLRNYGMPLGITSAAFYAGSFLRPIALPKGEYLFGGRVYENWQNLKADLKDGLADGLATRWSHRIHHHHHHSRADAPEGQNGNGNTSDILSNPGLDIEEKLMLMMGKFMDKMDKELEEKMGGLQKTMDSKAANVGEGQQNGGTEGAKGGDQTSNQTKLQEIQLLSSRRQQMFETFSNILKGFQDTSKAIIGNIRG